MVRTNNVRKITQFKRSIRAISPVIATLLMIAIAVVASLVVYAWVSGYMGFQTDKAGQAIALPSVAGVVHTGTNIGDLVTYVQNVGQGTIEVGAVYVDDVLQNNLEFKPDDRVVKEGNTVEITINGDFNLDERHDIKVTTTSGTSMTLSKVKPGTGGEVTPAHGDATGITVSPDSVTLMAGTTQDFTATATDGTVTWDVTSLTTWTVSANGGSFSGNVLTAGTVGTGYTVTAKYNPGTGDLTDDTPLTVVMYHNAMTGITVTPASAKVQTGATQAFTATATDGTVNWDVTLLATWEVSANGGTFSGNVLTAGTVGTGYTVTATVSPIAGSTSLEVTPAVAASHIDLDTGEFGNIFVGSHVHLRGYLQDVNHAGINGKIVSFTLTGPGGITVTVSSDTTEHNHPNDGYFDRQSSTNLDVAGSWTATANFAGDSSYGSSQASYTFTVIDKKWHIESITFQSTIKTDNWMMSHHHHAVASIKVTDPMGNAVNGVHVALTWTVPGTASTSSDGWTDSQGIATIESPQTDSSTGTFTITAINIPADHDWTYDAAANDVNPPQSKTY